MFRPSATETDMTNAIATTDKDPLLALKSAPEAYDIASIKEAGGEETPRFEAKITKGGKVVGTVSNDGCGGCNRYHFIDGRVEREAFEAWIKANHPADFEAEDAWVYKRLDVHVSLKQVLRAAKKKTLFRLATDEIGAYRTVNVLGPQGAEWVRHKYPGASVFDAASRSWHVVR
jgi:hypothetical protein